MIAKTDWLLERMHLSLASQRQHSNNKQTSTSTVTAERLQNMIIPYLFRSLAIESDKQQEQQQNTALYPQSWTFYGNDNDDDDDDDLVHFQRSLFHVADTASRRYSYRYDISFGRLVSVQITFMFSSFEKKANNRKRRFCCWCCCRCRFHQSETSTSMSATLLLDRRLRRWFEHSRISLNIYVCVCIISSATTNDDVYILLDELEENKTTTIQIIV